MYFLTFTLLTFISASCIDAADLRVAGGQVVADGQYPYMCSLRRGGNHRCGCVILNEYHALTGASCLYDITFDGTLGVWAGSTHINAGAFEYTVEQKIVHVDYNNLNLSSPDIAIVKLIDPLPFGANIGPATLPNQGDPVPTVNGVFLGWGWSANEGPNSPQLLSVSQKFYTDSACKAEFPGLTTSNNLCAEGLVSGAGLCENDEGGPLIVNGVVQGLYSWSNSMTGCSDIGSPGVFTRVSMFRNWISANSGA